MKRRKNLILALLLVITMLVITPLSVVADAPADWIFDQGLEFDKTAVERVTIPGWSPGTSSFTIELWIKRTTALGSYHGLLHMGTWTVDNSFGIITEDNDERLIARVQDDNSNTAEIWFGTETDGANDQNWHHIAVVYDKETDLMSGYIDGVIGATPIDISGLGTLINLTDWGLAYEPVLGYGDVIIAEFRLWSEARTPTEITDNMYDVLEGNEENLERYYVFEEGSGVVVQDDSHGGVFDNELTFDGVNQYGTFGKWSPAGTDFTIEYWFKQNDQTNSDRHFTADPAGSNGSFNIYVNDDNDDLVIYIVDNSSNGIYIGTWGAGVQDGLWHHIAFVIDRGNDLAQIYVDGIQNRTDVDISSLVDIITINEANYYLASSEVPANYGYVSFAELRMWNDVRTEVEIQDNIWDVVTPSSEPNLIRYYTFDDGAGASVTDLTDAIRDITLVNAPTWGHVEAEFINTPTWIEPIPAIMGDSSITIDSGIEDAIELTLDETYRPDRELIGDAHPNDYANMWAVTGYDETEVSNYYWVSVSGMVVDDIEDLDGWNLAMSLWSGLALVYDDSGYTAHMYGSAGYDAMLATAGLADISFPDEGGTGSATYYFPWYPGYVAYYGTKGIHTDVGPIGTGYGGQGWLAVDWVGGITYSDEIYQNAVYASQSGTVSYVCKDSVQTWVQIGNFLYGHLNDNATLQHGVYHSQGGYLGSLITGSHSTSCGYTSQRDTSYHLHIGFLPTGQYFQWEDWVLDTADETFRRGNSEISPGDYMLAEWLARPIVATPGPTVTPGGPTVTPTQKVPVVPDDGGGGGQIFDGFIAGVKLLAQERVDTLNDPEYQAPDMPNEVTLPLMIMSGLRIAIRSVYVLLKSNLNLTITLIVFGIILVLEPIRVIRAIWIGIKEMVPFL